TRRSIFSAKGVLQVCSIITTMAAVVVASQLMAWHTPFAIQQAPQTEADRRTGRWRAIYILGAGCPCSRNIANHLSQRQRLTALEEHVLIVGEDPESEHCLREKGWRVDKAAAERVKSFYGAISAPLLVVVDPQGSIRYKGGFARRSDARDGFHEVEIWNALRAGTIVNP